MMNDEDPRVARDQWKRLESAMSQTTLSGQLRRAYHQCGLFAPDMANHVGVSAEMFADWLEGLGELPSGAIDRLAKKLQIVAVHVVAGRSEPI